MKLLLVSDVTMNADQGGIAQTLYNLFCFWPPESILCTCSEKVYKNSLPSAPFTSRYVTYKFEVLRLPRNRFAKYFRKSADWINYSYNKFLRSFKHLKREIEIFNPDVIVTCPNGPEALFMHYRLNNAFKKKQVFPYFMDDWLYQSEVNWMNGNIQALAKKMLCEHSNWLMISRSLADILGERYQVKPGNILTVHNPVDTSHLPSTVPVRKKNEYTIAYAGSLWPMHFDAILIMAKAIMALKKSRSINLVVYTKREQWEWRKNALVPLKVIYGGSIPYQHIHQKLSESDALLVTSSFTDKWKTHTKGSIQTKLTDYLKAQRLIISCGPPYSANNHFLKQNCCGVCIETENEEDVVKMINKVFDNIEYHNAYPERGLELLKNEYSFEKVYGAVNRFLELNSVN